MERLRDKVAEGKIDKIYIHSPDRLSRKSSYQMILLEEFRKAGPEIVFLNHKFDDNPDSNLFLQLQGAIAEYERAKIMERNRRGRLHTARKGVVSVMARAPYGYRYMGKNAGNEQARFEINEEEASVVHKIFTWVGTERASIREVVRRLDRAPIITKTGKRYWNSSTVSQILKNPAYIGKAAFGKRKVGPKLKSARSKSRRSYSVYSNSKENWIHVSVPSIINEDLFNAVQKQLDENRKRARVRQRSKTFLLQGLLVCQRCQYAYCGMHGNSNKNGKKRVYFYYRCTSTDAHRFNNTKLCDNKLIRTDVLDTVIWEEVKSVLREPDKITNEYQRLLLGDKKFDKDLEKQENKLKRMISNLIDGYTQEYISKEEFESRIKTMRQRLKEIEAEKEKVLDQKKLKQELSLITDSLKHFSSNIESQLDKVDWQTKQNIIKMLVKQVEINHDHLYIIFRIKELANSDQNWHDKIMQCCTSFLLNKIEKKDCA